MMRNPRRYRWVPLPLAEPLDLESMNHRLAELPPTEELAVRMLVSRLMENGARTRPVLLAGFGGLPAGYWVARGAVNPKNG